IAHGCNSVLATRLANHLAEWTITEAGFGFDLGAEKFFDIKCRTAGLDPAAVVLVATVRALKMHGGADKKQLTDPDPEAVERGLPNLEKHLESAAHLGKPVVVALNEFATDTEEEIERVRRRCEALGARFARSRHHSDGGAGAVELAKAVIEAGRQPSAPFKPTYPLDAPVKEKVTLVAQKIYGARGVVFSKEAEQDLRLVSKLGFDGLPICVAKTQNSLSDDPALRGRPEDFDIHVRGVTINAGAGFLVVLTGAIMRMPGLPRTPLAFSIDLQGEEIVGLE
ncbi:MAG: formate--tetrahydrofolate ligase, partial [Acidobacteria bacterium]|nr:formate--tetrahydrofolate ligase [Acidobacteriota bacterium]